MNSCYSAIIFEDKIWEMENTDKTDVIAITISRLVVWNSNEKQTGWERNP